MKDTSVAILDLIRNRAIIPLTTQAIKGRIFIDTPLDGLIFGHCAPYCGLTSRRLCGNNGNSKGRFVMDRKCSRCKKMVSASEFSMNPKTNAIHGWCNDCRKKPMGKTICYHYSCHNCGRAGGSSYDNERKTVWVCNQCRVKKNQAISEARKRDGSIRKQLIRQRGERCEKCGKPGTVKMHHIVGVVQGGKSTPDNLILLCPDCHKKEHPSGWGGRIYR